MFRKIASHTWFLILAFTCGHYALADDRPNMIVIFIDELRWDGFRWLARWLGEQRPAFANSRRLQPLRPLARPFA